MKGPTVLHVGRCLASCSIVLASLGLAPAVSAQAQPSRDAWWASFGGEKAFVKPSQDAVMGFTLSTSVKNVLVQGGQRVKQGDLLVQGAGPHRGGRGPGREQPPRGRAHQGGAGARQDRP
jgi:hypothetical protein